MTLGGARGYEGVGREGGGGRERWDPGPDVGVGREGWDPGPDVGVGRGGRRGRPTLPIFGRGLCLSTLILPNIPNWN